MAYLAKFAPFSGEQAAIIDEMGIHFIDTSSGKEVLQIAKSGINYIDYSPRDTYLITSEKYVSGGKNLMLWHTKTGKEAAAFEFKKGSKEGPKSIKFTRDEKQCARLSSLKTIDVYILGKEGKEDFEEIAFQITASSCIAPSGSKEEG